MPTPPNSTSNSSHPASAAAVKKIAEEVLDLKTRVSALESDVRLWRWLQKTIQWSKEQSPTLVPIAALALSILTYLSGRKA